MVKFFAIPLMAASMGLASTSAAHAGCGCSSSPKAANPPAATARVQSNGRTFSYEPSMGTYRSYQAPSARGFNAGMRDAGSKVRGSY